MSVFCALSCALPLPSDALQGVQVLPEHLSVSAGVGAVLDLLFHCIAEPGAGVLIPAPYYPAFDNDLWVGGGTPSSTCCDYALNTCDIRG